MTLLAFLLAMGISLCLAPLVIWVYKKRGWIDDPKSSAHPKIVHTTPVPRGGGIVVGTAILLCMLLFLPLSSQVIGILIGAFLLLLIGFWDDIKDPSPSLRLVLQIIAALFVVGFGVGITYLTNPFGGIISFEQIVISLPILGMIPIVSILVSLVWMVWCMNIVNFGAGLDGQMPGYVVIAALTIGALSKRFIQDPSQANVLMLSWIVAGAYLGFLYWNMVPQKMMSGFGASTLAGFFLAILSMLSGAKLATAILVLAVPMADAVFVIVTRLKNKKSPFQGDRGHLHHALLDSGLTKRQVAFLYWAAAGILGIISLNLTSGQKAFTILLVGSLLCMIALWLRFFTTQFGKSGRGNG